MTPSPQIKPAVNADALAADLSHRCATLAGFEARMRRCQRDAEGFLHANRKLAPCPSELAFLLGQIHSVLDHCRSLQTRYRDERLCLACRVTTLAQNRDRSPAP
jgi:hypothetical protein